MKNIWKKLKNSTKVILLGVVLLVIVCCFGLFVSSKETKITNSLGLDLYMDTVIEKSLPKE